MAMSPRLLRPTTTGFTPKSIADLALWLDASQSSSVTLNSGNVSQWDDLSGNGRNFAQPTAAAQPLYATSAMNGKAVVRADGSNHWILNGGSAIGAASLTMFLVARHLEWIADLSKPANLFHTDLPVSSFSNFGMRSENYNNAEDLRFGDADSTQAFNLGSTSGTTLNVARVMTYSFNASTRLGAARRNGALAGSATINAANVPATFGGRLALFVGFQDTAGRRVSAEIAELVFYSRDLSESEKQKVERALGRKWGVAVA